MTEALRQNNHIFVNMLSITRLGIFDENTEKLLKAKLIDQPDKDCLHDTLHMYAKNAPIVLRNQSVLINIPGEV